MVEFDATLNLRRHALTRTALRAFLARPAEAARVLALIYGHALTLALRGARLAPDNPRAMTLVQAIARRIVLGLLRRMTAGHLELVEPVVRDPGTWAALLRGSRGLASGYVAGLWDSPDPTGVVRVAARNAPALDALRHRITPVREPYQRLRGAGASATRRQSREDIRPLRPRQ